ncbi:N-acetylmannosamine-6-phosphate 2-epimerase [Staphylococcus cohnii]|jgi:N-acylglucosamine-6-phosphate 2-epimerase|uniref:N-acetylmannosamine-6-phosphate 2-epimerase n=1 Tax=Staphylococcus TaxID=1279 RepID=UPI000DF8285B|nr:MULTISPECIES: N-acetylmannosamine-6-phosphate 2-epimerase [Staphylococcus]MCG1418056.1 N-acetylmannosamine-6-phosphate 2-epimerase [Staphylococcus epidermidis]MCG1718096.1 N-acetylmannosamine-6-phosphate 2-epimerase [Staphylococcus epidermidis]MCG2268422.1 N-acetylmannosamine-6-phosphate 2-epimerase [Staphylococcus epidermidis]MCY1609782.1 N-acetylmannosamine-6-phosphate 2-epimerase [Staphylococcus pettenkoferi]UXV35065.1 N-acetylmannosamine-6-phosphate 2-epimerase [Staphylococcus sp. IVB61
MLPHGLIVSCQALPDEPLHSSFIMSKMALAAYQGGAVGIRANTKEDIIAIKEEVPLPVIGIVKRDYPDSKVFITATSKEVDELIESKCEVIALDATKQERPKESLEELVSYIRDNAPGVEIMADISTVEEAVHADQLGFDYVGTTLRGYTDYTKGHILYENNFAFLKEVLDNVKAKVIAEGNVITPEMYQAVSSLGVHCTVVGGAITRPKQITERFVNAAKE